MKTPRSHAALALFGTAVACGSVPNDSGSGLYPTSGSIRGTVVYSGPHPCSSNGHIVGSGLVLVFDGRNLPPPNGLASTVINFGAVEGDVLFVNEPRYQGKEVYCPRDHGVTDTITASAPFSIGPVNAGSYVLESFYDYTGDFFPTLKIRLLPELGDVGGGAIDTADALKSTNVGNLNYQPHFLPVNVGIPQRGPRGFIPNYTLPPDGYVADNVTVTMGQVLSLARPYFYPLNSDVSFDGTAGTTQLGPPHDDGSRPSPDEGSVDLNNKEYAPILTIPQDIEVYAPPAASNRANVTNYELRFPKLVLQGGVPQAEAANAIAQPLHFQLPVCYSPPCGSSAGYGQIAVWQNAIYSASTQLWVPQQIPEGGGVPQLWPLVVLTKLIDDPTHLADPASVTQQGSQNGSSVDPVVVMQAITLLGNTNDNPPPGLFDTTAAAAGGALFDATGRPIVAYQDSLTVLLRPNVICFDSLYDSNAPDKRGSLVTPYLTGVTADLPNGTPAAAIVPLSVLQNPSIKALVKPPVLAACLPTGRYAINVVYPDGQAWTVPNEAGACQGTEGMTDYKTMTCTAKPRSVLRSQGTRAVVEITKTTDPNHCTGYQAVPRQCLPH